MSDEEGRENGGGGDEVGAGNGGDPVSTIGLSSREAHLREEAALRSAEEAVEGPAEVDPSVPPVGDLPAEAFDEGFYELGVLVQCPSCGASNGITDLGLVVGALSFMSLRLRMPCCHQPVVLRPHPDMVAALQVRNQQPLNRQQRRRADQLARKHERQHGERVPEVLGPDGRPVRRG